MLKARERVISSAERREISWGKVLVVCLCCVVVVGDVYLLLVTTEVDLPLLAFIAKTGDITREAQTRTLFGEDRRGIGGRAGHVKVADLGMAATGEVAQGNELNGSASCHC